MAAIEAYGAQVEAWLAQQAKYRSGAGGDRWGGETARRFRRDPCRALEPNLQAIAEFLQPDDVLVDVGGGAGRMCLPLAARCREVVCVDPSEGMGVEFVASAEEAGINNARFIHAGWVEAGDVTGDVLLTANVTYFVANIEAFIAKLQAAPSRRIIIDVRSVPPPNGNADVFGLLRGEPLALVPGHRELLPVLWDMGILPEVQVLAEPDDTAMRLSREEVIQRSVSGLRLSDAAEAEARALMTAHFDELFVASPAGYRTRRSAGARELLITWQTA